MTTVQALPGLQLPDTDPAGTNSGRSPLQRLLEAHRIITADLCSSAMIDRLLQAAMSLTGADFGAVAVLSASDAQADIRVHRSDVAERAGWRAVLEPAVTGSPAERARQVGNGRLLGTTVRARLVPFLELYVGVEAPAQLAGDAAQLLDALAEFAGTALWTALLHEDAQHSKDWLQASGEIARTLLSDADPETLTQVVLRALHVAEADSVGLFLPHGNGRLRVAVAAGRGARDFQGVVFDAESSAIGRAILRGESVLVDDLSEITREGYDNVHDLGPVMSAPLVDARGVRGSVVLSRRRGRPSYTAHDLDLATTFADQLALALDMDDARLRGEWVTVLEIRHRIAQDLHDNVMQRLFATGVGLQSLAASNLPADIARRLGRYITDLDETIDEIRTRVFGLRDADGPQHGPATSRFPYVEPGEITP